MRKRFSLILLLGLLTCGGCFTMGATEHEVRLPATVSTKAPPSVRPEQITAENGHQICQALEAELLWEAQQSMLSSR